MSEAIFTETELISKLAQTEDSFVERKSNGDTSGWLRTVVAFANSIPPGRSGVLFLGVSDDGQIASGTNVERAMQTFSDFIGKHAWPAIKTFQQELTVDGKSCVAITVPYSENRPHFAGRAYVRDGTQTKDASETQFAELIASRSGKAREILAHKGKDVSWMNRHSKLGESTASGRIIVTTCNTQYATFDMRGEGGILQPVTEFLSRIELGWDSRMNRLLIIRYEDR